MSGLLRGLSCLQMNVLAYFESLCTDAEAANMLINCSLTVLLVNMLRNGRQPALRARQATAIGLLLRHATHIVDELYSTSACDFTPNPNLNLNLDSDPDLP